MASPVARVHYDGVAVPLDARAELVALDGSRAPIRGDVQPVRDPDDLVTALAFVFRRVQESW